MLSSTHGVLTKRTERGQVDCPELNQPDHWPLYADWVEMEKSGGQMSRLLISYRSVLV